MGVLKLLRRTARGITRDVVAVWFAARDPATPRLARVLAFVVAAYALSPIDLIPDFIPVLGLLDDLVLVPLGLWLVMRMVPAPVMARARLRAEALARKPRSWLAGAMIVLLWVALAGGLLIWWLLR